MATYYFWDEIEDNVIEEYDENGNTIVEYTTEPTLYGAVLSQDRGGQVRHYHFDGQGNTVTLTDNAGNVTDTRKYSAFGEVTESTGTTDFSYQWGGRWGYCYNSPIPMWSIRAREFVSTSGRWMSVDPVGFVGGHNRYLFGHHNPVSFIDPSGLLARDCTILHINRPSQSQCRYDPNIEGGWVGQSHDFGCGLGGQCCCCEFRQYIAGYHAATKYQDGKPLGWKIYRQEGKLGPPIEYVEDHNPATGDRYGHYHFEDMFPDGRYSGYKPSRCEYRMRDYPGRSGMNALMNAIAMDGGGFAWVLEMNYQFKLSIINTCYNPPVELFSTTLHAFCCFVISSTKITPGQGACADKARIGLDDVLKGSGVIANE